MTFLLKLYVLYLNIYNYTFIYYIRSYSFNLFNIFKTPIMLTKTVLIGYNIQKYNNIVCNLF